MLKRIGWLLVVIVGCCAADASAQPKPDEGIPIQSELVRARCGGCHKVDDKMRMTRISYRRASPENWEKTIKRMVSLNHVNLDPADARNILKYLADHNGLAPEELRPVAFEAERRMIEYTYAADKDTSDTCSACHSIARVMSERRTQGRLGPAGQHAPRLLPAGRQSAVEQRPGVPPNAAGRDRARRRRAAARQPASDGEGARAPVQGVSARDAGVGGVVRLDAAGEAGRPLGRVRLPAGQGRDCRPGHRHRRSERPRQLQRRHALHGRANGRARLACREGARLHRVPVAWARRHPRERQRLARGDVRRARLAGDVGTLVHRRLRRDRHRREAHAPRLGSRRVRVGPDRAEDRVHRPHHQDLRRQPAGQRHAGRHRVRTRRQGDAHRLRASRRDRGGGRRRADRADRSARRRRWPAR